MVLHIRIVFSGRPAMESQGRDALAEEILREMDRREGVVDQAHAR